MASHRDPSVGRTKWLDGLRGIAAAIVFIDHGFLGAVQWPFRSYWAEPTSENRRLMQLPPFRILFAARSMVALFFVISGYAISINLLRARLNGNHNLSFYSRVGSAITRRIFRIYLPVLIIVTVSQVLFFMDLFTWDFGAAVQGVEPWTAPWRHVIYLLGYMSDAINPLALQHNEGLNAQLWTMPVEFRGSCVVYLLITGMARWRPRTRFAALGLITCYFLWYGMWDTFTFIAGLLLAELKVADEENHHYEDYEGQAVMGLPLPQSSNTKKQQRKGDPEKGSWKVPNLAIFSLGTYLLCLSDEEVLPFGYSFLTPFQPYHWHNLDEFNINWSSNISWKAIGAVLTIYGISNSSSPSSSYEGYSFLQRRLSTPVAQYLGKISFSLYLIHQSVYHLWLMPIVNLIWSSLASSPYPGPIEAPEKNPFAFFMMWVGMYAILAPVTFWLSDLYTRYVDVKCVDLARKLEKHFV
ncbi:uncharacterized protein TRUGW13939_04056 [Talaromyces rugulosus]|uniref:Acyltransferase 3 domain-containing protein n=1 Tax=Talaromyces rugulosus TaxID=121627 RepID=A0A7H8QT23_TALRU|nr:uncharacterized protein TRUGW13939_04056 [Talaromyces rugulosus]QKX56948.1 hypothetical protein TRUGW13939_04056 [Talaromyces rugulosus]